MSSLLFTCQCTQASTPPADRSSGLNHACDHGAIDRKSSLGLPLTLMTINHYCNFSWLTHAFYWFFEFAFFTICRIQQVQREKKRRKKKQFQRESGSGTLKDATLHLPHIATLHWVYFYPTVALLTWFNRLKGVQPDSSLCTTWVLCQLVCHATHRSATGPLDRFSHPFNLPCRCLLAPR